MEASPSPPPVFLETPRLRLRRLSEADLDRLLELDSDPEVMRHISHGQPTSRDTLENVHLPRMLSWNAHGPEVGFWALEPRGGGEFLGWFHLRPDKLDPAEMELGYRLCRPAWGKGFATEMGRRLVRRGLGEAGFRCISGRTLIGNLASRRVLEKCGLRLESEFIYPETIIPGWTEAERRAVKYSVTTGG
jgi:RimJ/RimL family protein N-acetyltransferase